MNQREKAEHFAGLHINGDPLILFNIWDAGSARAVRDAGAKAIATGSWSVAAANGYDDGEHLPLDGAIANLERIIASVDLPVTIDFEGGYAADISELKENIHRVIDAGAIGINFEDQVVGGSGLYTPDQQAARIASVREAAASRSVPLFINARTDVFIKIGPDEHSDIFDAALDRAEAYADAGADGLFAPALRDPELIRRLCAETRLPVNIMVMADTPSNHEMAGLGVGRISYGPGPYLQMIETLKETGQAVYSAAH